MSKANPTDPADVYQGMRQFAFGEALPESAHYIMEGEVGQLLDRLNSVQSSFEQWLIWKALNQKGHQPTQEQAACVFVTICEFAVTREPVTVVAHSDGNASMYLATGGGVIGGAGHRNVRDAAAALCATAGLPSSLVAVTTPPAPAADGEFVISVLTTSGIRSVRELEKNVRSPNHTLHRVYGCMHDLITQLRLVETGAVSKSRVEAGPYANCLLTLMSENGTGEVMFTAGERLPSLQPLARTAGQREWIVKEGPADVNAIEATDVMELLKRNCRFGWFGRTGTFHAILAQGNGTGVDVYFDVERGKDAMGRKTLRFRFREQSKTNR